MATVDRRGVAVGATEETTTGGTSTGLAIKVAALAATTANITLSGLQTIDGVTLVEGDRVLVWQQSDAKQNGLYNASSGNWTRTADAGSNDRLIAGMLVVVTSGTSNARVIFELTAANPIVLGTSSLTFVAANIAASRRIDTTAPLAGGGDLSANRTFSIDANGITYSLFQQIAASSLFGNPTGALATGQAIALGATLLFSGAALQTAAMSGDVATSANSFVTTIQPNAVTNSKLRQSAALSLIGNATNATADVADIIAASDNQVLRRSGTAIGFGAINLASTAAVSGTLPAANGGTGATSLGAEFTVAANVFHVANNGITYALFQQVAAVSLVGNPTGSLANAQGITLGATLSFSGSSLQTTALSGDVTSAANSFATTIAANAVTNAKAAQMAAYTLKGNTTGSTANASDFTIGGLTQKVSPAGTDLILVQDQAAGGALKYALVSSISSGVTARELLTANRSYYVTTNGSDSNSGLATATVGTVTFTNGSANVGWTAHGRSVGDAVFLGTNGTLPTNFAVPDDQSFSGLYFVKTAPDANTVTLALTPSGSAITAGSAGSGTHTATLVSPLATIQKAIDKTAALDISIYNATIWASAGTFSAANTLKSYVGAGTATIVGAGASNTTVDATAGICFFGSECGKWNVNAAKLTGGYAFLLGGASSNVSAKNHELGAMVTYGFRVTSGARLRFYAHTISGNATKYGQADAQSNFICVGVTVTLTGTPAFSSVFLDVSGQSYCNVEGVTWSGSATGARYTITGNGIIYTAGQATTWLPGNAAHGTPTASQGQYL